MTITMLKGKIHRATVTEAQLNYVGSITIDKTLLDASGILEYEAVQVVNIANGSRFLTYTIAGVPNSGTICLNGAAARLAQIGDKIIIMSYAQVTPAEASAWQPKIVLVDEKNRLCSLAGAEIPGTTV